MQIRIVSIAFAALAFAGAASAATGWPKMETNAADQALAKKSVLHITDFTPGTGWTAAAPDHSSSVVPKDPSCNNPMFSDVGRVITGSASTSFQASGIRVWSEAEVMKTLAMAQRDRTAAADPALLECLRAAVEQQLPAGVKFVSVNPLSFPTAGDWTKAFRSLVDVAVQGQNVRMQMDVIFVLHERVEISLMQMAPYQISSQAKAAEVRMAQRLAFNALTA